MSFKQVIGVTALAAVMVAGISVTQRPSSLEPPTRLRRVEADAPASGQPNRSTGRKADTPGQIPPRGWLQIAKRVSANISTDRVLAEAAAVTFYVLLALFPALAALISLYGLVADPQTIESQVAQVGSVVPSGGVQILKDQVHSLVAAGHNALGFGAIFGVLASIWSANAGVKAMFDALNAVYEETESRSFLKRTLISLLFTLGGLLFVIVALAGTVAVPAVIGIVGLGQVGDLILNLARWPVLLVVIMVILALLYRFGPSRAKARWSWLTGGSAFAAVVWVVGSIAFSFYVSNFGNYNKTYGSLGAAVGFMTWVWISTIIVLIGAEVNAEMEHQTERDTTIGSPKPLGQRGARKADQVAQA